MKTKQRVLLVLLAAAVLLGAALWAVIRSNAKAEQVASAAAEGSIPLSSFAAEDLEQIEYTFNGETYTLQYSGGSWQLAQDPAYHLDESACNTMRTALMALNAKRSLTPQAGEDYGLDSPQLTVTVTAAGQSTTLTFGAENPVTGDLYVQKVGDDAIYTVSGNKVACFQLDKAGLFGSFCPTGLTASAITQVAYTLADGTSVTLNAVSEPTESADSTDADSASSSAYETVWRLASDPAASLAQDKVQSLLSALCTYVPPKPRTPTFLPAALMHRYSPPQSPARTAPPCSWPTPVVRMGGICRWKGIPRYTQWIPALCRRFC